MTENRFNRAERHAQPRGGCSRHRAHGRGEGGSLYRIKLVSGPVAWSTSVVPLTVPPEVAEGGAETCESLVRDCSPLNCCCIVCAVCLPSGRSRHRDIQLGVRSCHLTWVKTHRKRCSGQGRECGGASEKSRNISKWLREIELTWSRSGSNR